MLDIYINKHSKLYLQYWQKELKSVYKKVQKQRSRKRQEEKGSRRHIL